MTQRLARFLISLYPRRWRERYGEEFLTFLQEHPLSIRAVINVIGGAVYQRFLALGLPNNAYTEAARRAFFFARSEASQFGSDSIEPEHLLLGVLREQSRDLGNFFADPSSIQAITQDMRASVTVCAKKTLTNPLPVSSACKRILGYAKEEADRLNVRIDGEHFLIGILREEKSHACEILKKHGLELAAAREKLVRLSTDKR
jgi:ATP-dependent Clp protease ATP-binding subunit ClpA